jgi:hypothetical protein
MKEKEKKREAEGKSTAPSSLLQRLIPHVAAVAVFAAVTLMYFSPMLLDNKQLYQSDIVHYKGMSKELVDFRDKTGEEGLWTNSMFGGMPAFQISVKYKGNLIQYLEKITTLGFPHPSQLLFQAMLFFYLMLIIIGVNPWLALAGALAYSLNSYNLTLLEAGHNSKMHCIALIPLVVAGILLLRKGNFWWGGVLSAVGFSVLIMGNHLQITYYLLLILMVYAIVEVIYAAKEKSWKNLFLTGGIAVMAGLLAVGSNLSLLWSTYEYLPSTIRGPSELSSNTQSKGGLDEDYAFQWSYGVAESFTLLVPNLYGGSSSEDVGMNSRTAEELRRFNVPQQQVRAFTRQMRTYWGDVPFTSGPFYTGALVCYLFILALLMVKERWKWWLLGVSVLSLFLAWGRNFEIFNGFLFQYLPGYNRFRTPSMALTMLSFALPMLGFVFLGHLVKGDYDMATVKKMALRSLYVVGGLCLLFAVAGGTLFSFSSQYDDNYRNQLMQGTGNNKQFVDALMAALRADRVSLMRADALRSLAFVVIGGGFIWLFAAGRIGQKLLMGSMAVLMFADLFFVGKRYLNSENFVGRNEYNRYFEPTPSDQLIMKETSLDYRVLNLATETWQDARTSYFHKSLGGYHAAKLRRYQEIIEHQMSRNDSTRRSGFPFNKAVVDMLNTKYIILPGQGQQEQVYPNTQALDNAWFIDSVRIVENADEEMKALNDFNPATTVIVDKRFASQVQALQPGYDSTATVKMDSYAPNDLKYTSTSSRERVIVFSEIYYQPGWQAFIDGKKTDHFRCNYILRGMRVPAGEHQIEFRFEPQSYFAGEKVAYGSSAIMLVLAIGLVYRDRRKFLQKDAAA